jgi:uncharacterized protein (DUF2384 family)
MTIDMTINVTKLAGATFMAESLVKELELSEAQNTFEKYKEVYEWDNADIAAALQVDRRTVQRYSSGDSYPTRRVRNNIADLREISILLDEIFSDQADSIRWLNTTVQLLKGRRPIDLIQKGKLDEVITALATFQSGAFR